MRRLWILLVLAAAAGGLLVFWGTRQPQWTTASRAALAEFERGLEAEMKYYHDEARGHYQRALELDPEFAMAKVKLLGYVPYGDKERLQALTAELRAVDQERLTERERFLVSHRLARADKQNAHAERILTAYLEEHPRDSYALWIRCVQSWSRREFADAEPCYRRLLASDPNWVQAQNHLGYAAMAQARFAEAEEMFRTYLYIAPDQANPHDSLGELYTLLGRYADAERELEEAVRIRPDFCDSWEHLVALADLRGDVSRAEATLARIEEVGACPKQMLADQRCRVALWRHARAGDWDAAWGEYQALGCGDDMGEALVMGYRAALESGHGEEARAIERRIREEVEMYAADDPGAQAGLAHLEGLRLLAAGDFAAASARLRAADERLLYWGNGEGIFKLINRLDLARALAGAGDAAAAAALAAEVQAVNPHLAARLGAEVVD